MVLNWFNVNIVYGNLTSENSQDYAQKPQRNCTFMRSASGGRSISKFAFENLDHLAGSWQWKVQRKVERSTAVHHIPG